MINAYEIAYYALIIIGLFFLFCPHRVHERYLPAFLAQQPHEVHNMIGAIALIGAWYIQRSNKF